MYFCKEKGGANKVSMVTFMTLIVTPKSDF